MTRCTGGDTGCLGHERCLTHDLWTALGDQIETFLSGVSLKDVLDGIPGAKISSPLPIRTPAETLETHAQ
jgi:DNA-binding IscR family transcriptional regulator